MPVPGHRLVADRVAYSPAGGRREGRLAQSRSPTLLLGRDPPVPSPRRARGGLADDLFVLQGDGGRCGREIEREKIITRLKLTASRKSSGENGGPAVMPTKQTHNLARAVESAKFWGWGMGVPFSAVGASYGASCLAFSPDGRRLVGGLQSGSQPRPIPG